jgi:NAD(P)-dependent dehydrogenase (short-subunit alcohol dehydrogenase family)
LLESFKINTLGNIHLFNLALPLIRKGHAKKVISISSGMADPDFIRNFSITDAAPYTISKGALNIAVAKFDAQFRKEGILFMAISPGLVATQDTSNCKSLPSFAARPACCPFCISGDRGNAGHLVTSITY